MIKDESESKKDVLREGTKATCPHCGEEMEVVGGKLVKGNDRTLFNAATSGPRKRSSWYAA